MKLYIDDTWLDIYECTIIPYALCRCSSLATVIHLRQIRTEE